MRAQEFFDAIAKPNAGELRRSPGDLRLAVNAIFAVDSLVGVMALKDDPKENTREQDKELREQIAEASPSYHLLRDMAFALKHGWLGDPRKEPPRLVNGVDQISEVDAVWSDDSHWDDQLVWSNNIIVIQSPKIHPIKPRADLIVLHALVACECQMQNREIPNTSLIDITRIGVGQAPQ